MRLQRGYSGEHLAALVEMDRTYVSGIERGVHNVSLLNIARLGEVLGVPLAELFEGVGR